jgi:hypothetical protein
MIHVRSQAAGARCASYIGEANRMWSAVCSLTSTADRLPGGKMMPGGGVAQSSYHGVIRFRPARPEPA